MPSVRSRTSKNGCMLTGFRVRKKNEPISAIVVWIRKKMKNK